MEWPGGVVLPGGGGLAGLPSMGQMMPMGGGAGMAGAGPGGQGHGGPGQGGRGAGTRREVSSEQQ